MKKRLSILALLLLIVVGGKHVYGTGMLKRNVADLIKLSELILVGKVVSVTDGLDGNIPYTEVTLQVSNAIWGDAGETYTFRQFGLLKPRDMGNGMTNLNVSPDGWPRFQQGERVMVFLYRAGAITGFRTTVGLFQGKFTIKDGRISNAINNSGLFDNVSVGPRQLSKQEQSMLQTKVGPYNAETFISFVARAVNEQWFNLEGRR